MDDGAIRVSMLGLAEKLDAMAYEAFTQSRSKPQMLAAYGRLIGRKSGLQDAAAMIRSEVSQDEADAAELDRILNMSEDELRAGFIAEGRDPDQVVADMKREVSAAIELVRERDQHEADARGWHVEYKQARREKNEATKEARSWRAVAERLETEMQELLHVCDCEIRDQTNNRQHSDRQSAAYAEGALRVAKGIAHRIREKSPAR